MNKFLLVIFGAALHVSVVETIDFIEIKRYLKCTLETNDYDGCKNSQSWLYKNYPARLDLYNCLLPGSHNRKICYVFGIRRSE